MRVAWDLEKNKLAKKKRKEKSNGLGILIGELQQEQSLVQCCRGKKLCSRNLVQF